MRKSDKSIHNICIASIKRSLKKPYDHKWSSFYNNRKEFEDSFKGLITDFHENELPICSVIIDSENWSIVTTRRVLTKENSNYSEMIISESRRLLFGNFKGYKGQTHSFGEIESKIDKRKMNYFIETSSASMIIVKSIQTVYQVQ
jgi:hypothetical protein